MAAVAYIALSFANDRSLLTGMKWLEDNSIPYELPGERDVVISKDRLSEIRSGLPVDFTTVNVISAGDLTPEEYNSLRRQWFSGKPLTTDEDDLPLLDESFIEL